MEGVAAVVFTLAGALHLIRAALGWAMVVGPYTVPVWLSWVGAVVGGGLAFHFWRRIASVS